MRKKLSNITKTRTKNIFFFKKKQQLSTLFKNLRTSYLMNTKKCNMFIIFSAKLLCSSQQFQHTLTKAFLHCLLHLRLLQRRLDAFQVTQTQLPRAEGNADHGPPLPEGVKGWSAAIWGWEWKIFGDQSYARSSRPWS